MGSTTYDYQATVVHVLDGDTADFDVDLGFDLHIRQRVRVYGINAPEVHTLNLAEKAAGLKSLAFAAGLMPVGTQVMIRSHMAAQQDEKYGRWLADITLPDGRNFSAQMLAGGFAQVYTGGPRPPWHA